MSDKVGYRNPPKHSQFKKGVSANPKGRPKRKGQELGEVINKVANTSTEYREGGRTMRATRLALVLKKALNRALEGDASSADFLFRQRARARRSGDTGVEQFLVEDWFPDYPGQTGEQKTRELEREIETDPIDSSEQAGPSASDPPDPVPPIALPAAPETE
jgi:hypothetical protein